MAGAVLIEDVLEISRFFRRWTGYHWTRAAAGRAAATWPLRRSAAVRRVTAPCMEHDRGRLPLDTAVLRRSRARFGANGGRKFPSQPEKSAAVLSARHGRPIRYSMRSAMCTPAPGYANQAEVYNDSHALRRAPTESPFVSLPQPSARRLGQPMAQRARLRLSRRQMSRSPRVANPKSTSDAPGAKGS